MHGVQGRLCKVFGRYVMRTHTFTCARCKSHGRWPVDMAMLPHLGPVLRAAREARQPRLTREVVAAKADCGIDKIRNLERGKAWPRSPANIDVIVRAYAELTTTPPVELWGRALKRWREDDATNFETAAWQAGQPPHGHNPSSEEDPPEEGSSGSTG